MPPKRMDPLKRPRGRPPLAANKRKYELLSHVTEKAEIAPKLKAVYHPPPPIPIPIAAPRPILMPTIVETKISIPKLSQPADQGEASGGKSSARNHYPVQRVLNKLLIEDPMTILSIGNALPDIPKDTLQATLDILQVLGYVIKVKTGTSSKDKDVNALFTTSNYAKSSEPAEVMQMATLTEQKWRNSELTKKRIQALHELSNKEMSVAERRRELKELMNSFVRAPGQQALADDPLYRDILALLTAADS